MEVNGRELWTIIHGMGFGALFLLAFAGGLAELYGMRPEWMTVEGLRTRIRRMKAGMWIMAIAVWLTVISGTFIVYPWYRAAPPQGVADLSAYPRSLLLASESTAEWHRFGMEWKEHVGWLAPIAATVVAAIISYYGPEISRRVSERRAVMIFFVVAFLAAAAAGAFGAFITKSAPVH
jgi:hypothetical protein